MGGETIFNIDIGADMVSKLFDYVTDWLYQQMIKLLGEFFGVMNQMSADLFTMPWVKQIVQLFSNFGWALFIVGIVVALFDFAIESQNGRGDPKALALNIIKGFFAVNLFCNIPIELYAFTVRLQLGMNGDMTGLVSPDGGSLLDACLGVIGDMLLGPLLAILIMIMMFSVPRGYTDGFVMWVKQVIATCLTAFLQSTMLVCGLILFKDYWLLGLGIMLAAGEIPRIAGLFGLETAVRPNINGVVNTAQSAVHLASMVKTAAK